MLEVIEWFTAIALSMVGLGVAVQKMRGAWARKKANGSGPPAQYARTGDVYLAVRESSKRIDRVETGIDRLRAKLDQHTQTEEQHQRETNEKLADTSAKLDGIIAAIRGIH